MATSTMCLLALLLSCVALSSTSGSAVDWMDLALADESTSDALHLTKFSWKNDNLTVCADRHLPAIVTLIVPKSKKHEKNHQAISVDAKCATFAFDTNPLSSTSNQSYALVYEIGDVSSAARATFTAAVEVAISITCGTKGSNTAPTLTRLFGTDLSTINTTACLAEEPSDTTVCYATDSLDIVDDTFCYMPTDRYPDILTICIGLDYSTQVGGVTIDYLEYSSETDPTNHAVTLALSSSATEVLVMKENGDEKWYPCTGSRCQLTGEEPSTSVYSVCAVTVTDGNVATTATDTITDLKVASKFDDNMGLEFKFNNVKKTDYTAFLSNSANNQDDKLPTVTVDCTDIDLNNHCYGFLSYKKKNNDLAFFTLEYDVGVTQSGKDKSINKIVMPMKISATGNEEHEASEGSYILK